jgi:hypothetical protein
MTHVAEYPHHKAGGLDPKQPGFFHESHQTALRDPTLLPPASLKPT